MVFRISGEFGAENPLSISRSTLNKGGFSRYLAQNFARHKEIIITSYWIKARRRRDFLFQNRLFKRDFLMGIWPAAGAIFFKIAFVKVIL